MPSPRSGCPQVPGSACLGDKFPTSGVTSPLSTFLQFQEDWAALSLNIMDSESILFPTSSERAYNII